jgi:hypothetical protein
MSSFVGDNDQQLPPAVFSVNKWESVVLKDIELEGESNDNFEHHLLPTICEVYNNNPSNASSFINAQTSVARSDFYFGKTLGEGSIIKLQVWKAYILIMHVLQILGSYAQVVLAKFKANDRICAIKIIEKSHIIRENKVKEFFVEKEIMSKIAHSFIVR